MNRKDDSGMVDVFPLPSQCDACGPMRRTAIVQRKAMMSDASRSLITTACGRDVDAMRGMMAMGTFFHQGSPRTMMKEWRVRTPPVPSAPLAQRLEQRPFKSWVVGSNPTGGTTGMVGSFSIPVYKRISVDTSRRGSFLLSESPRRTYFVSTRMGVKMSGASPRIRVTVR